MELQLPEVEMAMATEWCNDDGEAATTEKVVEEVISVRELKEEEEAREGELGVFMFSSDRDQKRGDYRVLMFFLGLPVFRRAMFGFAVGMLTEYATGSDLLDQVKILLSSFGILEFLE